MKKLVILGFDGTLADTSPGMLYCFNTTATAMGYQPVDHKALDSVYGESLEQSFKELYGMSDDETEYAKNNYSKLYSQKGKKMYLLYDGLLEELNKLKAKGCKLAVATLKHNMYTSDMLKSFGAIDLFDAVCATDVDRQQTKSDLLLQACKTAGVAIEDSIMVGDSNIDAEGAKNVGMDYAAVLYGWGYKSEADIKGFECKTLIKTASELSDKILKL